MPISPRLRRKLHGVLGADASEDMVRTLNDADANQTTIRELRHETQLGFARVDARIDTMDSRLTGQIAALDAKVTGQIAAAIASMEALIQKGLREQMRFFFLAWAVLLAAIVGLYAQ
jgi:hypothetical protein